MAEKVDTAADLEAAKKKLEAAQAAHDEAEKKAAGPREPETVVTDLLERIVMRLGNRPELRALLTELEQSANLALQYKAEEAEPPAALPDTPERPVV
jgi:hypothetical protein